MKITHLSYDIVIIMVIICIIRVANNKFGFIFLLFFYFILNRDKEDKM